MGIQDIGGILWIVILFAVMYFVMIRPQKKKEKETKLMLAELKKGDVITTIGGIMGKIEDVKEEEILLRSGKVGNVNEQSVLRITKWAVRDVVKKAEVKQSAEPVVEEPKTEE